MSLITNSAYPRQSTSATSATGLWKTLGTQDFETQTGEDQYESVDRVFAKTLRNLSLGSQLVSPCSFVAPKRFTIMVDQTCIIPKTVKIIMAPNKLMHVIGLCQVRLESGIYAPKEFRKAYKLPHFVRIVKVVPLFTEYGHMIIELPIMDDETYGGRFGGEGLGGSLHSGLESENVRIKINMAPKEELASFGSLGLSTGYPSVSMPGLSDLSSFQRGWKTSNGASISDWDESKFDSYMTPSATSAMGYKGYEF